MAHQHSSSDAKWQHASDQGGWADCTPWLASQLLTTYGEQCGEEGFTHHDIVRLVDAEGAEAGAVESNTDQSC